MPGTISGIHAHVGIATCDLDAATKLVGEMFGLTFTAAFDGSLAPPFMDRDGNPTPGLARVCTSVGGPMRVELLQGCPGSVWDTGEVARLHHLAYWVTDVTATAESLQRQGWNLEVTLASPTRRPSGFAYLTRPGEARVEVSDGSDLDAVLAPLGWAEYAPMLR